MSLAEGNSTSIVGSRRNGLLLNLLRVLLALGVLALLGVGVGAALSAWVPAFVLFQAFAAQVTALAAIATVLGLALRMRLWVLVPAALALWQGALLLPFLWPAATPPVIGTPLRVLSINLWLANPEPQETIDYLLASGADVIATVETTPDWRGRLTALDTVYPYHVDCPLMMFRCGAALFSKRPFTATYAGTTSTIGHGPPIVVRGDIDWDGKPLTVAALQVLNPMIGLRRGFQARQGGNMTRYFADLHGDAVLMGDFNSTPWGSLQSGFRAGTGFDNRGRLAFTWPSWAPAIFRLPIDQIFAQGAVVVRDYRAGPAVGSDHLPVLAEIYRRAP
jgi:endonuclease/exonuclease/phosphatase (EEP) superfamily protein YafD